MMRTCRRAAVVVGALTALTAFGCGAAGAATAADSAPPPSAGLPDPTALVPALESTVVAVLEPTGLVTTG